MGRRRNLETVCGRPDESRRRSSSSATQAPRQTPRRRGTDPPSEQAIEGASDKRRKSVPLPRDHGQCQCPCERPSFEQVTAMARDKTEAALAPSAWMTAAEDEQGQVPAKAHRMLPAEKMQSPARTSHLRPNRSERGPARSWPKAKAMKKLLSVSPSSWADTPRSIQPGMLEG